MKTFNNALEIFLNKIDKIISHAKELLIQKSIKKLIPFKSFRFHKIEFPTWRNLLIPIIIELSRLNSFCGIYSYYFLTFVFKRVVVSCALNMIAFIDFWKCDSLLNHFPVFGKVLFRVFIFCYVFEEVDKCHWKDLIVSGCDFNNFLIFHKIIILLLFYSIFNCITNITSIVTRVHKCPITILRAHRLNKG